jgi:transposase
MVQKCQGQQARRALAILRLAEGAPVARVAEHVEAARSTIYRWMGWYHLEGEAGLTPSQGGRPQSSVTQEVMDLLQGLAQKKPETLGYLRSSWTSEMLALEVNNTLGTQLHDSTVRRLMPMLGYGWRRSRPTLCIKDHKKAEKMKAIDDALQQPEPQTDIFYVDEVDIDLNPKTGFCWSQKGKQTTIPTPGKNQKRYIAGALHARTGKVVWVEGNSKSSDLFIALLEKLRSSYRRSRKLILILDNYIIHKSRKTLRCLASHTGKFQLLFQPVYHPWVNRIERLWKALHDTVTRNHRYPNMDAMMGGVRRFMEAVQPFPGAGHALAKVV